jgi:hypothetical protein
VGVTPEGTGFARQGVAVGEPVGLASRVGADVGVSGVEVGVAEVLVDELPVGVGAGIDACWVGRGDLEPVARGEDVVEGDSGRGVVEGVGVGAGRVAVSREIASSTRVVSASRSSPSSRAVSTSVFSARRY